MRSRLQDLTMIKGFPQFRFSISINTNLPNSEY
jgi:hypothetical protein